MGEKKCDHCQYFFGYECRRFPPAVGKNPIMLWPHAAASGWCGEWVEYVAEAPQPSKDIHAWINKRATQQETKTSDTILNLQGICTEALLTEIDRRQESGIEGPATGAAVKDCTIDEEPFDPREDGTEASNA